MELVSGTSPKFTARLAGSFYLITFVAGFAALLLKPGQLTANLIATVAYVAVTLLFFDLFRAVSRRLSLLAAVVGLVGCGWGALATFDLAPLRLASRQVGKSAGQMGRWAATTLGILSSQRSWLPRRPSAH